VGARDTTVESGLGRLKPEYIKIRDWLGSAPREAVLAAVSPGESSRLAMPSSPVSIDSIELDETGENVTIQATITRPDGNDSDNEPDVLSVNEEVPINGNSLVEVRGEIDGIRLLKIDVEALPSTPVAQTSPEGELATNAAAEGELVVPEIASAVTEPLGVQAAEASSSTLTMGDVGAEGESIASAATTQADLFVPVASDNSTRTDATVLALEEGDLWLGESLQDDSNTQAPMDSQSIDTAMENVATELTIVSSAADSVAEQSTRDATLDENAIDAVLMGNL